MGGNESVSVWGYNIGGGVRGEGCDEPKVDPNIVTTCSNRVLYNNYLGGFFQRLPSFLTFTVENGVVPLHTYSDLRKREKLGILSVVTVSSL